MGPGEGTHGPNGSHRTGPVTRFLSKPEAHSRSSFQNTGLGWDAQLPGKRLVRYGSQVLCDFLCCREELAQVLGGGGLLPEPGFHVHEGKYLAVWPRWCHLPQRSEMLPTTGSPSRPVLIH